jgi:hypothetical protein
VNQLYLITKYKNSKILKRDFVIGENTFFIKILAKRPTGAKQADAEVVSANLVMSF